MYNQPIMILKSENTTFEIYLLNPGCTFQGFGGSKQGLTVRKTASLIIRRYDHESGSMEDSEYDIDDHGIWSSITKIINRENFTVEH
jgi:hypothetical protein